MKRRIVLVSLLLAVAMCASAQEDGGFVKPWAPPVPDVTEGARMIAIGFWGDVVGLGLIAGASAAFSLDAGVGGALLGIGVTSMLLVGNPCLNYGLTTHHDAVVDRGFDVREENRDRSRLFSKIALGLGGGSVVLGIGAAATDSLGLYITAGVAGLAGTVVEILNFYMYRTAWSADLKEAAGIASP